MTVRLVLLCLIGLSPMVPAHVCSAQAVADKATAPTLPGIDEAMRGFVEQGQISGAVTLVAHEGKVVHRGAVGKRDLEADKPMRPGSLFSIASMTKPIVATGLMILQDEGKLDVSDPVSRYLPAFADVKLKDGSRPEREITLRDAITHTAGLAGSQLFEGSLAGAVDELATRPLAFEPGTKWQYSPGLNVAGRVIEKVSGMPLDEFLHDRLFEPLGMKNTTFYPDDKQRRRVAQIYRPGEEGGSLEAAENRITNFSTDNGPNPSGGLVSSAPDLFRFYQMVLGGGEFRGQRILSAEAVRQMTSPQTGELETGFTPGNCWGLGWCIVRQPQGVTEMLSPGSFGHGGAFGTQGWIDPKTETIYVLLIQRTGFGNSDASEIRRVFQSTANEALGLE